MECCGELVGEMKSACGPKIASWRMEPSTIVEGQGGITQVETAG